MLHTHTHTSSWGGAHLGAQRGDEDCRRRPESVQSTRHRPHSRTVVNRLVTCNSSRSSSCVFLCVCVCDFYIRYIKSCVYIRFLFYLNKKKILVLYCYYYTTGLCCVLVCVCMWFGDPSAAGSRLFYIWEKDTQRIWKVTLYWMLTSHVMAANWIKRTLRGENFMYNTIKTTLTCYLVSSYCWAVTD